MSEVCQYIGICLEKTPGWWETCRDKYRWRRDSCPNRADMRIFVDEQRAVCGVEEF